jgi:hypothetical protein
MGLSSLTRDYNLQATVLVGHKTMLIGHKDLLARKADFIGISSALLHGLDAAADEKTGLG